MDERLQKALEFSNYQKTLELKINTLKLRYEHMLICKYENDIFKTSMDLISYVNINKTKKYVIVLDSKNNPVKIESPKEFLKVLQQSYNKAIEEYFEGIESLKKARTIKKVIQ